MFLILLDNKGGSKFIDILSLIQIGTIDKSTPNNEVMLRMINHFLNGYISYTDSTTSLKVQFVYQFCFCKRFFSFVFCKHVTQKKNGKTKK